MPWHDSWHAMNRVCVTRDWMTKSEMFAELRRQGFTPTHGRLNGAFRRGRVEKPPRVYGYCRYSQKHLEQFRTYLANAKKGRPKHVAT